MTPELYEKLLFYDKVSQNIEQLLELLSGSDNEEVRKFVARNNKTPKELLLKLAKDSNENVREQVSFNVNLDNELMELLAKDSSVKVRINVATAWHVKEHGQEHSISPNILAYLSEDIDDVVRSSVADNRYTPPEVLDILADDSSWNVRWGVAMNGATPIRTIWRMGMETVVNDLMQMLCQRHDVQSDFFNMILEKSGIRTDDVYKAIIQNPNVSVENLDKIISNENISPEVMCMAMEKKLVLFETPRLFNV